MKKIYFAVATILIVGNLLAQDNVVKIHALTLGALNPRIHYERVLSENNTVDLQLGVRIPRSLPGFVQNELNDIPNDVRTIGYNVMLDFRFYGKKADVPSGKYLAPFIMHNYQGVNYNERIEGYENIIKFSYKNFGGGILFGSQKVYDSGFALDIFGGIGLMNNIVKGSFESDDPQYDFQEIEGDLNTISVGFFTNNLTTESTPNSVEGKTSFLLPTLKFGVLLGFGF